MNKIIEPCQEIKKETHTLKAVETNIIPQVSSHVSDKCLYLNTYTAGLQISAAYKMIILLFLVQT